MNYAIYILPPGGDAGWPGIDPEPVKELAVSSGFDDDYARHVGGELLRVHNEDNGRADICIIQLEPTPGDCQRIVACFDGNGDPAGAPAVEPTPAKPRTKRPMHPEDEEFLRQQVEEQPSPGFYWDEDGRHAY